MGNPVIGKTTCAACEAMGRGKRQVEIQLEREGAGMAYYICDGRADPSGLGCSYRAKFGRPDTEQLKRMMREAGKRQAQPQDQGEQDGLSAGDERTADSKADTGSGDDFLA